MAPDIFANESVPGCRNLLIVYHKRKRIHSVFRRHKRQMTPARQPKVSKEHFDSHPLPLEKKLKNFCLPFFLCEKMFLHEIVFSVYFMIESINKLDLRIGVPQTFLFYITSPPRIVARNIFQMR